MTTMFMLRLCQFPSSDRHERGQKGPRLDFVVPHDLHDFSRIRSVILGVVMFCHLSQLASTD